MMTLNSAYQLRGFEIDNPHDVERLNLMYYHPDVMKAKGYWKKGANVIDGEDLQEADNSMADILNMLTTRHEDVSYAVADMANKLVGWIWFYRDSRYPLPKRVMTEMGLNTLTSRVYQVSYEKLMSEGWSKEILENVVHTKQEHLHEPRKGVIVEGLRLAIIRITTEFRLLFPSDQKLVLYGFVSPRNVASRKVLERNGFVKAKRKYRYCKILHDLWVKII